MKAFNRRRTFVASVSMVQQTRSSCLSQNRQLCCSRFVYERVVFLPTGIGKDWWAGEINDAYFGSVPVGQVSRASASA